MFTPDFHSPIDKGLPERPCSTTNLSINNPQPTIYLSVMPPKKKSRLASRAASTVSKGTQDGAIEDKPTSTKEDATSHEFPLDAWTDEQEISLFKGVVRWKPVGPFSCYPDQFPSIAFVFFKPLTWTLSGMHKHFRMIALSQHLRNHGFNPAKEPHTRIPGIWKKLRSLYNLEALDERVVRYTHIPHDTAKTNLSPGGFFLRRELRGQLSFRRTLPPIYSPRRHFRRPHVRKTLSPSRVGGFLLPTSH